MRKTYPTWLKTTVTLLGIALIFGFLFFGKFLLMPLAFASLIAMLLEPISKWLEKWKVPRALAIILSLMVLAIFIAGIVSLLSIQILQFTDHFAEANEKIQQAGKQWLSFFQDQFSVSPERQINFLQERLSELVNKGGEYASTVLGATTSVFTTFALLPVFVFFLMYYKEMYRTFLHKVSKNKNREVVDSTITDIQKITQNYIVGMMMVIIILALLNGLGLWLVGLEHALFFAIFAAILAIIPYVGIIIGSLPAVIYALLFSGSLFGPLAVIGVFVIVQFLEGHFITPNIVGSKVRINPFMAILALLLGGELWGIAGMILFVPFLGILKCIFDQVPALKPYGYLFGNIEAYDGQNKSK